MTSIGMHGMVIPMIVNQRYAEFAKEMSGTIHKVNPSVEVSASLNWKAQTLQTTAEESYFIIPKINISNSNGIPLSKAIKTLIEETQQKMVIELLTLYCCKSQTEKTFRHLQRDFDGYRH